MLSEEKTYHNLVFKDSLEVKKCDAKGTSLSLRLLKVWEGKYCKALFPLHGTSRHGSLLGFFFNSFLNATGTPSLEVGLSQRCDIQIVGAEMFLKKLT